MEAVENVPIARSPRTRQRSVVVPLLLIGLGLLFLAQNLGWLSLDLWSSLWQFWPVLLVLVGVEIILGRGSWLSALAVGAIVLLVGAIVVWTSVLGEAAPWRFAGWYGPFQTAGVERVAEDLNGARQATVDLRHSAGRLAVSSLPAASPQLIVADLGYGNNTAIGRQIERRGDRAIVNLQERNERRFSPGPRANGNWTVQLSSQVPTELRVASGASQLDLDLRLLAISRLNVETGASQTTIVLPQEAGYTSAEIDAGMSSVEITVPEGVAARLTVQRGLGGIQIDESRFQKVGANLYQSRNYDTATNRVELSVKTGLAGITIR